ncbi:MAG: prolipoprotein diacylglyceryl transferase [Aquificae bacterium]|nr:prolipoprotein diacylglyceryl transferase [Aquificota bacterium]
MFPFLEVFGLKVPAYGIMLLLAALSGFLAAVYFSGREGIPLPKVEALFFWVFLAALVGARLFYVVEHGIYSDFYKFWEGGLDFFGGFTFATLTLFALINYYRLDFWKTVDAAAASLLLAHSVGRLSCWLAGCCYGRPTDLPIGVVFPEGSAAPSGIPLYPTQLMEATGNFVGFLVLYAVYRRKPFDGAVASLYLVWYGTERFLLEFLRGTTPPLEGVGLTWNQLFALGAVFVGLSVGLWRLFRHRKGDRIL